jgi:uncharacterized membrane protein
MVGLLLGGFGLALLCGAGRARAGQAGIATIFACAGCAHFVKAREMAAMLPAAVPARRTLVIASGLGELALAAALVLPPFVRTAGLLACAFLVAVAPINVYAAVRRVDLGGHGDGPRYLLLRLPLQALLVLWTYGFAVRGAP